MHQELGDMHSFIGQYIKDKELAWAPSTLKSEEARLRSVFSSPLDLSQPDSVWLALKKDHKPYTLTTMYTRLIDFIDFLIDNGLADIKINFVKQWRNKNARLFKHAYRRVTPTLSYEEAIKAIQTIPHLQTRSKAMGLIQSGLRWTESRTIRENSVIGKGNKRRPVFGGSQESEASCSELSYHTFRKHLRSIGLKPHDLRKIAATEFYRRGLSDVDLCYVMGWNSFETARSYLKPKKDEEIRSLIKGSTNE